MILAVIHPLRYLRHRLAGKLVTIKLTYEILCSTATERTTRVDIANQHPFVIYLEEVRTFPDTAVIAVFLTK